MKTSCKLLIAFACLFVFGPMLAADKQKVDFVHPLHWFSGMKETKFQVLIHGDNIAAMNPEVIGTQSIVIDKVVKVENPNYLILYLDTKGAEPQTFNIRLSEGKKKLDIPYQLKPKASYDRPSFSSADVLYLLMPDRFANGNPDNDQIKGMRETLLDPNEPMARHGGDLKGMTDKLDYLQQLGVTAIWPTPLQENDMETESYHGYAITDYYHIDPRFGSNEDYKHYVEEAHKRGIKVVMDLVFNHCGSFNQLFVDLPQDDWFNFKSKYVQSSYRTGAVRDVNAAEFDKKRTTDGWFVKTMPDWNQRNPLVRDYLIQTSIWWIEYAGIDGIRQDTYPYNDFDAMVRWCERIEQEYPGFNIVGEAWINNNVGVSFWQKDSKLAAPMNSKLPTVMDFPLMSLLNYVCDQTTDEWDNGFAKLYEYLSQDGVYADTSHLLTFLDNHDTDRFQKNDEMAKDTTRYKQALILLLTLRGIPQLYYGDEIGMAANKSNGDGALRQNFPGGWNGDKSNAFTSQGRSQLQNWYFDLTSNILNWRKQATAVHNGKLTHFHVRNGIYVYARHDSKQTVTVMLNGTNEEKTLKLEPYAEVLPSKKAVDVLTHTEVTLNDSIVLQPKEVLLLDFD